ncbi:hypothetical protein GCM10009623_30400 [Nocardioides aestuarii]|uniref:GerMN domain-containing protein n=1 Tax=Nocardioides aestuarii TaxID=252231 RepID=A0ABW4TQH7_9ACTN
MTARELLRTALLLVVLALATTGCVGIPSSGPVTEAGTGVDPGVELGYYNDPRPPTPGASPTEVVKGFLDAQTAIPLQTNTAEQYLTASEAETWRHSRIVTYATASPAEGSNQVRVQLDGASQIDARGSWLGSLPRNDQELTFTMTREDGEWRIDDAPDALVVPESWFGQAYRRVSLYYPDPTGSILVPEPVYVPRGDQLTTSLVEGLLQGPVGRATGIERSALPAGATVDLSVVADSQGVAEVDLTGGAGMPAEPDATLMVAQLARTLAQDPGLTGFRVTLDGEPVTLSGGRTTFPMDEGQTLDPVAAQSTSLLFGLREGRLVLGVPGDMEVAGGPLGTAVQGVRSVAVNLTGARVAAVAGAGDALLVSDVRDPDAAVTEVLSGATDLLAPSWDHAGRIWAVDRTSGGATVTSVRDGRRTEVTVPGITGERVTRALVSRDGSRLVAVLDRPAGDRPAGDRIVVSRLRYDGRGRPLGGTRARTITWDEQPRLAVLDIGWSSATSVVVAHRLGGDLYQVRTLPVDGAPAGVAGLATTVQERPRSLVSSPRATDPVYVVTRGGLTDALSGSRVAVEDPPVTSLTYVG